MSAEPYGVEGLNPSDTGSFGTRRKKSDACGPRSESRTLRRILVGKLLNAGQTCIAPDVVRIHRDDMASFLFRTQKLRHAGFAPIRGLFRDSSICVMRVTLPDYSKRP